MLVVLEFYGEGCHDEDGCCVGVVSEELMDLL